MAGAMNIRTEGCDVICRNSSSAILSDTYFLPGWSAGIPADAISTDSLEMGSGQLCCLLNAGRTEEKQAWFQTLDEDPFPVPDNRHLPVWPYGDSYYNESPDGIETVRNSRFIIHNNEAVYDLSGRKIANGKWLNGKSQGIYITEGKKKAFRGTR